jgi:hypothetical protein
VDFNAMINRALRAARLDIATYNEVEQDTSLNQEALMVVVLASLLSGLGALIAAPVAGGSIISGIIGLFWAVVWGILGYYVWSYLTWWLGTSLFGGTADSGELLRTLGYASAPRALGVLVFIPCVGPLLALVGGIWALVCGIVAVREALDFSTGNAVITVIIGWLVVFVVGLVASAVIGVGALGLGALTGALQ